MTPGETFELRPGYTISRVVRGGWQLAGGHGTVDSEAAVADLTAFCEAGISTFDCADIYTGVEDLIGEFRTAFARKWGVDALKNVKVHTKFVPNLLVLPLITKVMCAAQLTSHFDACGPIALISYNFIGGTTIFREVFRQRFGLRSSRTKARLICWAQPILIRRTRLNC